MVWLAYYHGRTHVELVVHGLDGIGEGAARKATKVDRIGKEQRS